MTLPLDALAFNPYEQGDIPTWRKAQQKQAYSQQIQSRTASSPFSDTARTSIGDILNQRLSNQQQSSAEAVQSTQQAASVQQQRAAQYQSDLNAYQTQQAQDAFNKKQQEDMNALWEKYNVPNGGYNPGTTGTNAGGSNASGQNTAVTHYTGEQSQIAQLARNAGFAEADIPTVVAIAMAESGGNAAATHTNADSHSSVDYGLMQINGYWHSDLMSASDWKDPQSNMNMAYQIYKAAGNNFSPWATYNGGQYDKYMAGAEEATRSSFTTPIDPYTVMTTSGLRRSIITQAETYIGIPYEWGGTDLTKGVDCSGLVQQVYKQFGINLPRVSAEQSLGEETGYKTWGVRTSMGNLEPGDLVYFYHSDGQVHHIAIWLGDNQILEAPHTGATVHIRTLGPQDQPHGLHLYGLDPAQPNPTVPGRAGAGSRAAT